MTSRDDALRGVPGGDQHGSGAVTPPRASSASTTKRARVGGMGLLDTVSTSLRGLANNKLRSGLTALGIIIGVTAVVALMAIGQGAQEAITSRIRSLGTNLLFISPGSTNQQGIGGGLGSAATLTLDDAYALYDPARAPDVALVAPESSTNVQVSGNGVNTRTRVVGVTAEYEVVRNAPVYLGTFVTDDHVTGHLQIAVLGSRVAETLFGDLESAMGQTMRISGRPFTVVGVLQSKGGTGLGNVDDQIVVPITTLQDRLLVQRTNAGDKTIQQISVQAVSEGAMTSAQLQVSDILRERHQIVADDDFVVTNQQDAIATITESTNVFVIFLGAIAGISLFVGGIGIMNIMLVSVTERTREIGIRKAVGAKRRDIMLQFLGEAGLLSLVGGLVGVALGWATANLVGGLNLGNTTLNTVVTSDVVFLALGVAIAVGLASGLYPALRAARLNPIEALRYE